MKKILLILLMAVFAQPSAMKAQTPTLVLHHADGKTSEVELYTMPRIQMTADKMIVTVQGSRQEFSKTDVLRFTYAKKSPTGISEQVENPTEVFYENDVLVISQLKANAVVSIYALDGKLIRQLKPQRTGTYRITLSELPLGLYLVKADNVTYKITKR